jgi:hypothetical protein
MRGGSIDYTAHMYSIQEHTSVREEKESKARQPAAVPWPAIPGRAASDGPGAAPWLASRRPLAHERGSEAGTAPAGKRRLFVPGAGRVVCERGPLSAGRSVPSGPLWLRRSGPRKACGPQLCRHLPQGSCKVCGQLPLAAQAVSAAIAFVSTRVTAALMRRRAGVPRVAKLALRNCQPLLEHAGAEPPQTPPLGSAPLRCA